MFIPEIWKILLPLSIFAPSAHWFGTKFVTYPSFNTSVRQNPCNIPIQNTPFLPLIFSASAQTKFSHPEDGVSKFSETTEQTSYTVQNSKNVSV
jgi:hypothetical protein